MKYSAMSKSKKFWVCIGIISYVVVVGLIILMAYFLFFGPTQSSVRKMIYDDCSDDSNYVEIYGSAEFYFSEKNNYAYFEIYLELECLQTHTQYSADRAYRYEIDSVNLGYLKTTDFFNVFTGVDSENPNEKHYTILGTVKLTVIESIWWDGDEPNFVSLSVDDTTYIYYETGKANLLYYIQNVMY